jgi:3-oxo-5-alpha-steroid 4-dehydrogenase 1
VTLFVYAWCGLGLVMLAVLLVRTAPYGRHAVAHWGPVIPSRVGWLVMETPSVVAFLGALLSGVASPGPAQVVLLVLWEVHYVHRAFFYPFRIRDPNKPMPLVIALFAFSFTSINGFLNGRYLAEHVYPVGALTGVHFLLGASLFVLGLAANQAADRRLFHLRKPGETGYKIPDGPLFRYVSCPNYLGEIVEWIGFAIASDTLAAWSFALWTVANLLPRALAHHRFYRERFPDYPKDRRALIPFVL